MLVCRWPCTSLWGSHIHLFLIFCDCEYSKPPHLNFTAGLSSCYSYSPSLASASCITLKAACLNCPSPPRITTKFMHIRFEYSNVKMEGPLPPGRLLFPFHTRAPHPHTTRFSTWWSRRVRAAGPARIHHRRRSCPRSRPTPAARTDRTQRAARAPCVSLPGSCGCKSQRRF